MSTLTHNLPATFTRVEESTPDEINRQIEQTTEENVVRLAALGSEAIANRLQELDREWDIERTLEANAATLALVALTLGFSVNRKWFLFPVVIAAFLLQHALQGWCPPLPIFRKRGVRTAREIDLERTALRIIRGDFQPATSDPREAFRQAKRSSSRLKHFPKPMWRNLFPAISFFALPAAVMACPICDTPTGEQVRAGIFGAGFFSTLLTVLLPFPILLVAVLIINRALSDRPAVTAEKGRPSSSNTPHP